MTTPRMTETQNHNYWLSAGFYTGLSPQSSSAVMQSLTYFHRRAKLFWKRNYLLKPSSCCKCCTAVETLDKIISCACSLSACTLRRA